MRTADTTRWALALCACAPLPLALAATPPEEQMRIENKFRDDTPRWSGDILEFNTRDLARWRTGYWVREVHEGRGGWWWVVDDIYYPYAQVEYPYPDPFTPSLYAQPNTIRREPASSEPALPTRLYYCVSTDAYYPYVPVCSEGWVPARVIRRSLPAQQ